MSSKRVRVRSLEGGTSAQRKTTLRGLLFNNGVKFSRLIEANEAFIAVCLEENDVDAMISVKVKDILEVNKFEVIIPPPLRARKSIVIRRLEPEIVANDERDIKHEIQNFNEWAIIEEVVKLRNINHMLKIRFRDIAMAKKAMNNGLVMYSYHISQSQIEQEEFFPLTPCWTCYKYDHAARVCPNKDLIVCSECAQSGHRFRDCKNRDTPKCLNCAGSHRTLAAQCPIRKDIIKKKRDESKTRRASSQATYAQATRSTTQTTKQAPIPKQSTQPATVLNLNSDLSVKILTITINAHLHNIARPGTFGRTVKHLLQLNGLPEVILPDNAPSADIFGVISGNRGDLPDVNFDLNLPQSSENSSDDETEVTEGAVGGLSLPPPLPRKQRKKRSKPLPKRESEKTSKLTEDSDTYSDIQMEVQPTKISEKRSLDISTTSGNAPESKTRKTYNFENIKARFIANKEDSIPPHMPSEDLIEGIKKGKVKYMFCGEKVPDDVFLGWVASGKIDTRINNIHKVSKSIFSYTRNGWQDRSSGSSYRVK